MAQLPSYVNTQFLDHVCRLNKALYGFKETVDSKVLIKP